MKMEPKPKMHICLVIGLGLNAVALLANHFNWLPDIAQGFISGVATVLMLLGVLLSIVPAERLAALRAWKRKLFRVK